MAFMELLLTMLSLLVAVSSDVVQTNTGPVQGKVVASGKVEAFLGIPYAEPPIGPLRFSKPVPKTPWQEVYDATSLPPACTQVKLGKVFYAPDEDYMSEDCLYLNLWVPNSKRTDEPKTIMLFIHGGGFMFGASNQPFYHGEKLAEHGDVIVATINYRLGGLGFLTDFTDNAPGSVGLYDQVMAIKWVKENAKNFNGDPENIVLFGESAGAFSVSFHQISPLSKNLFKRAILESGSAVSMNYGDNNAELKRINQVYAELAGCKHDDDKLATIQNDFIACLRKLPAEMFSEIDMEVFMKPFTVPVPRVGNDLLPENIIDSFRKGHFKNSEVLMGITRDEGPLLLILQRPDLFGQFGEAVTESMFNETTTYHTLRNMIKADDSSEIENIIRSYMDDVNEKPNYTYLKAIGEATGDLIITCGAIFQAEYQSLKSNPVFFYMFDHHTAASPHADWIGVAHGDELQFVFGRPMHGYFTEYEKELSRDVMDMWVTFAKTGNPTIPGSVSWPKYTNEDPKYFIIGQRDSIGLRPDQYRCERWRNLYRSVIDDNLIESLKQES